MQRIIKNRRLTQDEIIKYTKIREQVEKDLPDLIKQHNTRQTKLQLPKIEMSIEQTTKYNECWKPVINYENFYEVSNYGNVRSCDRVVTRKGRTGNLFKKGQILRQFVTSKGYLRLSLSKNSISKNYMVHRLVAETFLPNTANKTEVNHKDGNKINNRLDNLEWCTSSENLIHAYDNDLKRASVKYLVICNTLNITTFGCLKMEKELKKLGYSKASSSAIWNVINKGGKHLDLEFSGYLFEK